MTSKNPEPKEKAMKDQKAYWESEEKKAQEKCEKARGKATIRKWFLRVQDCKWHLRKLEEEGKR